MPERDAGAALDGAAPEASPASDAGRRRALALVRWGGCAVVGGALVAAAAGTLAGSPALAGLGVVVAAEEALEFAVVLGALRVRRVPAPPWRAPRSAAAPPANGPRPTVVM